MDRPSRRQTRENILLADTAHALLADFGIARAAQLAREDRLTATGVSLGTPAYMAPEQALGEGTDARADVWALGCVVFEMLTGAPPFGRDQRQVLARSITEAAPSLRTQRPDVPRHVSDAVERALARSPDERFRDAEQFGAALAGGEGARPGQATLGRSRRARPIVVGAFVLAGVVAATLWTALAPTRVLCGAQRFRLSTDSLANELYRQGSTLIATPRPCGVRPWVNRRSSPSPDWCERALAAAIAPARALMRHAVTVFDVTKPTLHQAAYMGASLAALGDTAAAVRWLTAYQPRADLHYQLHLKRDDGLRWTAGRWGQGIRQPDPR